MSLQQQIEEEIQREAKIDRRIETIVKRLLKYCENRKYRLVSTRKEADGVFIFNRSDLTKYTVVLNEEDNERLNSYVYNPNITMIFFKNKNPHNGRKTTLGDIRNAYQAKKFYD